MGDASKHKINTGLLRACQVRSDSVINNAPSQSSLQQRRLSVAVALDNRTSGGAFRRDSVLSSANYTSDVDAGDGGTGSGSGGVIRRDSVQLQPGRRGSVAVGGRARRGSVAHDSSKGDQAQEAADGLMFPVQLSFGEGDEVGLSRAVHNLDAEAVKTEGWKAASHAVVALEPSVCITFTDPALIEIIRRHHFSSLRRKIGAPALVAWPSLPNVLAAASVPHRIKIATVVCGRWQKHWPRSRAMGLSTTTR